MDRMFTFKAVKYKTFRKAANVQAAGRFTMPMSKILDLIPDYHAV
jgi:hypothetical protein